MVTACYARFSSYSEVKKSFLIGATATLVSAVAITSIYFYATKNLSLENSNAIVYGTLASIVVGIGGISCLCYSYFKKCDYVPPNIV
ncbi:MAG: hypothetical protein HZB76_01805 [Chlamydiae bacterium]|nr:hypothetical protein [Chlamydiota bacterium]